MLNASTLPYCSCSNSIGQRFLVNACRLYDLVASAVNITGLTLAQLHALFAPTDAMIVLLYASSYAFFQSENCTNYYACISSTVSWEMNSIDDEVLIVTGEEE